MWKTAALPVAVFSRTCIRRSSKDVCFVVRSSKCAQTEPVHTLKNQPVTKMCSAGREIREGCRVKIGRGEGKSVASRRVATRTIWIFRVAGGARLVETMTPDAFGRFRADVQACLPAGGGDGYAAFDLRLGWGDITPRRSSTRFSQCRIPPVVSFFS